MGSQEQSLLSVDSLDCQELPYLLAPKSLLLPTSSTWRLSFIHITHTHTFHPVIVTQTLGWALTCCWPQSQGLWFLLLLSLPGFLILCLTSECLIMFCFPKPRIAPCTLLSGSPWTRPGLRPAYFEECLARPPPQHPWPIFSRALVRSLRGKE